MIILFVNSKGGTGKTTLSILFTQFLSNYILGGKKHHIMLVDADYRQNSIRLIRQKEINRLNDRATDFEWNYSFFSIDGKDINDDRKEQIAFNQLKQVINQYYQEIQEGLDTYMVVDLPGTLSDIVISMINIADILIIPFEPTEVELNTTTDFLEELVLINKKRESFLSSQKIFMIPNKIQRGVKYASDTFQDLSEQERKWQKIISGIIITPPIPSSVSIKRIYSTAVISQQQAALVSPCFSVINYGSNLSKET